MRFPLLPILVALAAACSSPEASRARGGGPGADPGNRGESVELHGKSDPFHATPRRGAGRADEAAR